jgi:aminopeptidase 2
VVLSNGGEDEYNAALNEFCTSSTCDGRNAALGAIGQAQTHKLIQRTLALMLSKDIKQQDIHLAMKGLRLHRDGIVALWEWLKQNWDTIQERLSPALNVLSIVVGLCTDSFTCEEQLNEVESFFEVKITEGFDRALMQSFDAIRAKGRWLERDMKDMEEWLHERHFL